MEQNIQTKNHKLKTIACLLFCAILFVVVTFCITFTNAYFGDVQSGESAKIVIATLKHDVSFPTTLGVLEPSKQYTGTNYQTTISSASDSDCEMFVKVKFESSIGSKIKPVLDTAKWAEGSNGEYYYLGILGESSSIVFNTGYQTLNTFTNSDAGQSVTVRIIVSSIQSQYGAIRESSNGWSNAPQAFKTYYGTLTSSNSTVYPALL